MRRAKLTVKKLGVRTQWVRLIAANGEVLMHSEIYETPSNARRAKADIEAAMADYLESKGYVVTKAAEAGR